MCGVAGIFNFSSPDKPVREDNLQHMLSAIRHRGPDESGIYLGKNIGLGNVRLSIIDLASGQQPLSDNSGKYWIVYNGEVFNYLELREELITLGYQFRTSSDTEVVVQAYAHYGSKCLEKFNGQFAFAIWNKENGELFLARDRVGIRPLFYTIHNGSFYFCSEIKGLFENPEIPRQFSSEGLSQIFTFWTTITPRTPFDQVYELPPGHFMEINANGTSINKFWELSYPSKDDVRKISLEDAADQFEDLFRDAVRIRLRADVQVAAYLSGGIDSSVTTAFIKDVEPGILNTFSIGFREKEFDETEFQEEASRFYNTKHISYSCTSEEIAENFIHTIKHAEFPILRTAPTPMYLLSKKVRENGIKVVITGEGADEMLAGYNIFKESKIRRFWARQPQSALRPLLLTKLYPYLPAIKNASPSALKMFFGFRLGDVNNPYYSHILRWHNTSRIKSYFSSALQSTLSNYDPMGEVSDLLSSNFEDTGDLAKAQFLESSIFMSGYLLSSQGDRMAMGNSVEGRYPFLDYRVIEFCANLPDDIKLNGLNEKYLLKKLMKGRIPESILSRSKQAYRAPIGTSFYGHKPLSFVEEELNDNKLIANGIFDPLKVAKLIAKIKTGKNISEVDNMALAGILSTQLLHTLFIKRTPGITGGVELANLKIIRE
jgi:asparagine synthase (glutamine-hydrolysing)